jgi:alkaline phosphatase D
MKKLLPLLLIPCLAHADSIPLVNPGIEITNNVDATPASDPSLPGWGGDGVLSEGDTDYGNGRWKLLFDESESVHQLSNHQIETGAAYSIVFDAALNPDTTFIPANAIIGGSLLNGDFNADTSIVDSRTFADTPRWYNLTGNQTTQATTLSGALPTPNDSRNAALSDAGDRQFALDTGYTLTSGQKLELSYQWRDGAGWDDATDQVRVILFSTSDNTPSGTRSDIASLLSGPSTVNNTYESFSAPFAPIPAGANGKRLFVVFEGVDGNASSNGFANLDNFTLSLFNPLLVGPNVRNGDFDDDTALADSRTFNDTPFWTNLTGNQTYECTRTNILFDGTRNAVLRNNGNATPIFANDTGYDLVTGDILTTSFRWRDAFMWDAASDRASVFIFTTTDNTVLGTRTVLQTINTPTSTATNTYELFTADFAAIPASANGKRLFVGFTSVDGNNDGAGYGRVENFFLSVNEDDPVIPPDPPEAATGTLIAEAYVGNTVIASRTFTLTSQRTTEWKHYHLAIPAGVADVFAGQEIGVRFRGPGVGDALSRYVDNVRLDYYPSALADGSFSHNWNSVSNRVWPGPGYWGNRLHDWEVRSNRINCILGNLARRTLHRVGTSVRGNGENFTLSVRTGLNAGSTATDSKSGFLIGAGTNLDWRGSLLVHDGLGRDFGTFLGIKGNGAVVIDDISAGAVNTVATGATPAGGLPADSRLELSAVYNSTTGEYTLTIQSFSPANALLSSATTTVPSDRILGSFGLLSHGSSGNARFWFDDFSGSGAALQPEPERNLAIIGALYTLNRGTLRMSAHVPPVDLATTLTLETRNGNTWTQIATAPLDNTDNLSSYTATFEIPNWNDSVDTPYRIGIVVDGDTYYWEGTVRHNPIEKEEIVVVNTSCQRIADGSIQNDSIDWSPKAVWHPHSLAFDRIVKFDPDVLLALGDQIYEGQPTFKDTSSPFAQHHDYLYKWYLWMLEVRELSKEMPTISIPDDHDVYQGNLWGEGGIFTTDQTTGGYESPASWVRLVDRTQTSHMPTPDPYNATQPAPPIAQGIKVYFTEMSYGEVGFAVLEDRKFKTGSQNFPTDPNQQVLLGQRQKDFLKAWSTDWVGQKVKCAVSQSPFGMIHTHASAGYGYFLNDRDTHGWPVHRRNEAWELLRLSRSFQLAGDQHIGTLVHHGVDGPADAGYSFTSPAISNFFPRCWDPVHSSGGRTATVSPYKGDFYLNGRGTLPSGQPNLTSDFPSHIRVVGAANPLEYYNQTRNMDPPNLHDRSAGYGIIRIEKTTRQITFEAWPLHADPEFPQTGSQFPDWPVTINQTDNDGRTPTGFLPVIDTLSEKTPVVSVYDESTGELVYSMRFAGNIVRPPAYNNATTYRVDISYGDDPVSEMRQNQSASLEGPAAIHSFTALHPSIINGDSTTLQWNVESVATLTINQGEGDVSSHTVNGIGHLLVSPNSNTTYTLTLNGTLTAQATVLVFPTETSWLATHFPGGVLSDDPDGDGFTNDQEFQFQTDPNNANSVPTLVSDIVKASGTVTVDFTSSFPLHSESCTLKLETSVDLETWSALPSNSYNETARNNNPAEGTTQISVRLSEQIAGQSRQFYRVSWEFEE